MTQWDGKERRKDPMRDDHDLLTKIDANLSNFMRRFDEHTGLDLESFKTMEENFQKLEPRINRLEKFMWVVLGAVIIVNFAAKFFK